MSNTQNLDLKKMDGNPKVVNFNHKEFYENNFDKIDDAVGAKPADLTTTAKTIIPAINELKSDKVDKVEGKGLSTNDFDNEYKAKIDVDIPAQLAENEQKQGLLSGLLTTAKTSIVNAINELFNSKANKAQEEWITPTLLNGWVNIDASRTVKYFKDQMGIVHLKGGVRNGASLSTILTLPVGYRPSNTYSVFAVAYSTATGRVQVRSSGAIESNTAGSDVFYLDGITFRAEG